jgi:hypothetical protein
VRTQDTHLFAIPSVSSRSISAPVAPPRPVPSIALQIRIWLDDEADAQKRSEQAPVSAPVVLAVISSLPRMQALSPIQRHVLRCVAAHCWTHYGAIPYHPPTEHQASIARDLAGPAWRLLLQKPTRKPTYTLTRLGDAVARRVLQVVPAAADRARECEFDRMRALMRHDLRSLTTLDVDDDDDA